MTEHLLLMTRRSCPPKEKKSSTNIKEMKYLNAIHTSKIPKGGVHKDSLFK